MVIVLAMLASKGRDRRSMLSGRNGRIASRLRSCKSMRAFAG